MAESVNLTSLKHIKSFHRLAAVTVAGVGVMVLCGWIFDWVTLQSVLPGLVAMKANTAIAFVLAGISLWGIQQSRPTDRRWSQLAAAAVLMIGGLTLAQYLWGLELGIDQLLFDDNPMATQTPHPGRMAPAAALNFVLAGLALLLIDWRAKISLGLALPVFVISLLALVGYLFGVRSLYQINLYASMALHTATTFIILALGIWASRPSVGLMAIVTSQTSAGFAARSLLPVIPLAILSLGWIRLQGEELGLYDGRFGLALMVVSSILFTTLLTAWIINIMYKADLRAKAENEQHQLDLETLNRILELRVQERTQSLERSGETLFQVFETAPVPMLMAELGAADQLDGGKILLVNSALTQLLGFERADIPDLKTWSEKAYPDPSYRQEVVSRREAWFMQSVGENIQESENNEIWVCGRDEQRHLCEIRRSSFDNKLVISLYDITERKRLEEELRAADAMTRQYLDALPIGVVIIGSDRTMKYINQGAQKLLNKSFELLTVEEILPTSGLFMRGSDQNYPLEQMPGVRALQGKHTHIDDLEIRRPDGILSLEAWGTPVYDAQGQILAGISALLDITQRKRLEEDLRESEATTRQYLDALPIGVSIMGADYTLKYMNTWAQQLLSQPLEPVAAEDKATRYGVFESSRNPMAETLASEEKPVPYGIFVSGSEQLYPLDQLPTFRALLGERVRVDNVEVRLPERTVPVEAWGAPVYNKAGQITAGISTYLDISERLSAQRALEQAKEAAEAASQAKGDFLANMSHEIRTPLNAIVGLNYLLLGTSLSKQQQDYVENNQQAARTLLALINDVLDMSKIEAGKLELEAVPFELNQVLERLINLVGHTARDKGLELLVQLAPDVPLTYIGDRLRLKQVLLNLVGNAIKFTERGEISIEIALLEQTAEAHHLRFAVRDTGIGISALQAERLFQAFSQADSSTTRRYGGTGLGLSISRFLVSQMQGQLDFTSVPGQGSTFTFDVWLGRAKDPVIAPDAPPFAGQRALVLDDNELALETLQAYLTHFGLRAENWLAGRDAVEALPARLAENAYDLMLIDASLASGSSLNQVLSSARLPKVVLLSDGHGSELQAKGIEVSAWLKKPVTPSRLYNALLELIGDFPKPEKSLEADASDLLRAYRGARLLLVEDNPINQRVARELLEAEGFVVDIANHGEEALALLSRQAYALVLMDLQMPVMDGLAATREIRSRLEYQDLPIIAMTADAFSGMREQMLKAGMNDYLTKPIELDVMFKTLAYWLSQASTNVSANLPANLPADLIPSSNAEVTEAVMTGLPALDSVSALRRLNGNKALLIELLTDFNEELMEHLPALDIALQQQDLQKAAYLAHMLKGAAATLGLKQLQLGLQELEKALQTGQDTNLAWQACEQAGVSFRALFPLQL